MWRKLAAAAVTGAAVLGVWQTVDPGTHHNATQVLREQVSQYGEADEHDLERRAQGARRGIESDTGRPQDTAQSAGDTSARDAADGGADDASGDAADAAAKDLFDDLLGR